jgi:DNA polymerase-1
MVLVAKKNDNTKKHLCLVDGSGYIFRAYHALPPLTRKSDGLPVGAVSGFCNMLLKLMQKVFEEGSITHLAVIFDSSSKTFRNDIFPQYKAHRPEPPEDLIPQFSLIRKAVEAFSVPSVEMIGFEADDIIATYARQAVEQGMDVQVISSDKDLMQLVNDNVTLYDPMKDKILGHDAVIEKFGVPPLQVIDVQALAGDSTDNIPGIAGIGVKTAAQLIQEFGNLENLLANANNIKQPKRRQSLIDYAEAARISKMLVTLKQDVPLKMDIESFAICDVDAVKLISFLKSLEFTTIVNRISKLMDITASAIESANDPYPYWNKQNTLEIKTNIVDNNQSPTQQGLFDFADDTKQNNHSLQINKNTLNIFEKYEWKPKQNLLNDVDYNQYETILTIEHLEQWIQKLSQSFVISIDTETTSLNPMQAELVGLSFATNINEACYIPFTAPLRECLSVETVLEKIKPILINPSILKILHNAKYDLSVLTKYQAEISPIDDTMLLSMVQGAGKHSHGMDALALNYLQHETIKYEDLTGKGKKQISFADVPLEEATKYAAEDADITLRLWHILSGNVQKYSVKSVYEQIERPMPYIVKSMEEKGILIDKDFLHNLSNKMKEKLKALEQQIHILAGEEFLISSPKQLGEILFEKLGLKPIAGKVKKTASGQYATGVDILEELSTLGYEIAEKLLEWRQLSKLISTYTDTLPNYIETSTGRVHTNYHLAGAVTGRFSSSDPNIQNIPIKTDDGRAIRQAFIANKDNILLSADYSQIELRILAHIADIKTLKEAFKNFEDIHTMTAMEVFSLKKENVTSVIRRSAKAINFGIIYGISAYGLSNQLRIPQSEAREYINKYFAKFPGIKDYMEQTKKYAANNGYVQTLFGRKIWIKDILSQNYNLKSFSERAAINAPIQGSAADIIKRAMIKLHNHYNNSDIKMLMQVHDELVFEIPEHKANDEAKIIKNIMQKSHEPLLKLSVPLEVETGIGKNWADAH